MDCTKSEKFYNLNLELYGSTTPPIIQPESVKPTDTSSDENKKHSHEETDPSIDDSIKPTQVNSQNHFSDTVDTTEEPQDILNISQVQEPIAHNNHQSTNPPSLEHVTQHVEPIEGIYIFKYFLFLRIMQTSSSKPAPDDSDMVQNLSVTYPRVWLDRLSKP